MTWNDAERHKRISRISKTIVGTPTHVATMAVFQKTFDRHRSRPEGTCAFVLGETRAGKTTACEDWMFSVAERMGGRVVRDAGAGTSSNAVSCVVIERDDYLERPVLKVQVDSTPTYKRLFADVVATIVGTAPPRSMTFQQILALLSHQMVKQKTRMLIFDDVQHICEHRGSDGIYKAADVFKVLMKTTRVQIALVGLPHAAEMKAANDQLAAMTTQTHLSGPYAWPDAHDAEFVRFLQAIESEMPFDNPSDVSSLELAARIHAHTDGYVGRVSHLLIDAVEYAIDENLGFVDRRALAGVLRDYRAIPDEQNPFLVSFSELQALHENARKDLLRTRVKAEKRQTRKAGVRSRRRDLGVRGK